MRSCGHGRRDMQVVAFSQVGVWMAAGSGASTVLTSWNLQPKARLHEQIAAKEQQICGRGGIGWQGSGDGQGSGRSCCVDAAGQPGIQGFGSAQQLADTRQSCFHCQLGMRRLTTVVLDMQ